ncbi:MAG: fatty acid desaturase [Chitinophagaceae bacterium]|nr:fatty acid desaturase [Chitinophagaceae bacterium]
MISKPVYFDSREERELFKELAQKVKQRVAAIPEDRDVYIKIKAIILPLIYFGSYVVALFNTHNKGLYVGLFALMGVTIVLIYLNLIHEAAHDNIYRSKRYNKWVLNLLNLLGANSYIWRKRHILSHHHFPNVDGWDTDVEQSGPIQIFPNNEPVGIQKYQDRYFIFIYPFYLFNWMLLRDFKDFFGKNRVIRKVHGVPPVKEKVKLILYKVFYLFYQIAVPVLFFKASFGLAFGAWFLQVFVASVFALAVLLPLHPLPDNEFPVPDDLNKLPFSWMKHQLEVTNDLTHNNWFIRHILGNFNFHIAHHLFPGYSYVYYNEITDEIVKFAEVHHLRYKKFPLTTALKKHYELLHMNAKGVPLHHVLEELDS